MDMARIRRHNDPVVPESDENVNHFHTEKRQSFSAARWFCLSMLGFVVLPVLIYASHNAVAAKLSNGETQISRRLYIPDKNKDNYESENAEFGDSETLQDEVQGSDTSSNGGKLSEDPLLHGLLLDVFSAQSCYSRRQAHRYRKASKYKPSAYLIERLRKYEALHRKCGPYSPSFKRNSDMLKKGKTVEHTDCKYIVWIAYSGLGNRIVTIAATFLYALLTDRVLLIDSSGGMKDLFCEPFPNSSWFLPDQFPLNNLKHFNESSTERYGFMLNTSIIMPQQNGLYSGLPSHVYLHLTHNYDFHDKLFFCENEQRILKRIPWLLMKTDNYFLPSFHLMPSFAKEMNLLFPNKNTVFHHVGRYLFHPSNPVWGLITRFYNSYLGHANKRIGLQIRTYDPGFFPHIFKQVMQCSLRNKVLPEVVDDERSITNHYLNGTVIKPNVVLVTSLDSGYYERIRSMYWEHPTVDGQVVSVYQPSHEEWQQTDNQSHNMKAWAEMYLLSLSDVLITSPWSTFGYVAQGLAGIKPFIMYKPENDFVPDPPCQEVLSMEPCFHAPPFYDCQAKKGIDTGKVLPFVKHCEDISWGLKIADDEEM